MTSLKDVNFGINEYCGPSVLSILTGESTDRCAAVISAVSGRKEIKGTERAHLREALKRLRFEVKETDLAARTLYMTMFNMRRHPGIYIVFVPKHVIAVEVKENEIYICDNHSKSPLDISQSARLGQKVEAVWHVVAKDIPKFIKTELRVERMSHTIVITLHHIYENPEDNTRTSLGSFNYTSLDDLTEIAQQIMGLK